MNALMIQEFTQSATQAPSTGSVWAMVGVVAAAGAVGGTVNALLSSNGFPLPKFTQGILQLGVIGNVILGAFAALITWGLYGPLKDAVLLGTSPAGQLTANLTVTAVVGAALAGAGGARVISNEIDKKFFQSAATVAAQKSASPELAAKIATTSPAGALNQAMQHT